MPQITKRGGQFIMAGVAKPLFASRMRPFGSLNKALLIHVALIKSDVALKLLSINTPL